MASKQAEATTVDCHAHILPSAYVEVLRTVAERDGGAAVSAYERVSHGLRSTLPASCCDHMLGRLSDRVPLMDRAGVDVQVLSSGSSLAFAGLTKAHRRLVSAWNDAISEEIDDFPDRFRLFATVPFPDLDGVIEETLRVMERQETVGFLMNSHIGGIPLADERWEGAFKLWDEIGATVFCHPDGFRAGTFKPAYLRVDVGTQFEDTLTALQLIESGIIHRYPAIRWIVPHLGGTLPFVMGRVDEHWERDRAQRATEKPPSAYLDALYFDTAGHDAGAVKFAFERFGADRLVFGTDFPMVHPEEMWSLVDQLRGAAASDGEARAVLSETPAFLLRWDPN